MKDLEFQQYDRIQFLQNFYASSEGELKIFAWQLKSPCEKFMFGTYATFLLITQYEIIIELNDRVYFSRDLSHINFFQVINYLPERE